MGNDLAPVWNHIQEVDWDGEADLLFKVVDKDFWTSNDTIGTVLLPKRKVQSGFSGILNLEAASKNAEQAKSTLAGYIDPHADVSCCGCFSGTFSLMPRPSVGRLEVRLQVMDD